ncbi:hypothetical protein BpHYR1_027139 [Brachionus plicatilis]|uniref:Uncharacterized protein n=1 Tax=Brachionus plicatilis TaxID=10195 RepID=A0A3M7PHK3_BRAPC|nr:hypothetical protein BpHYR1_027139 [Brachionus plicatilis]
MIVLILKFDLKLQFAVKFIFSRFLAIFFGTLLHEILSLMLQELNSRKFTKIYYLFGLNLVIRGENSMNLPFERKTPSSSSKTNSNGINKIAN